VNKPNASSAGWGFDNLPVLASGIPMPRNSWKAHDSFVPAKSIEIGGSMNTIMSSSGLPSSAATGLDDVYVTS
jgi:hypothetical protein